MGRRGPPPTPTALRVLRGNPSKKPLPPNEPRPEPVTADIPPPPHLDDDAKAEWQRLIPELSRHVLTVMDLDTLALLCQQLVILKQAYAGLRKGLLVRDSHGLPKASPFFSLMNRTSAQVRVLMAELGMTPASRSRISKPTTEEPVDAAKAKYFG